MRFSKPLGIALLLLAAQLSALGSEVAVLRNGFSIRHERREQIGNVTRLYTDGQQGYVDIQTQSIASFEPDEPDVAPVPPIQSSAADAAPAAIQPQPGIAVLPVIVSPVGASPQSAFPQNKAAIDQLIRDASGRHQLDPDFVSSVIKAESNFQPRAVSKKGAQGLMQLMPATAALLGVNNPFDPKANVEGGTAYLSQLLDLYHNDPIKALAAYNAGANRVQQYHGVPPYRETKAYVARIVRDFNARKQAQTKAAQARNKNASKERSQRASATTPPTAPPAE
jgi:soluble lytic murein transglycosylase-like protein